MIQTESLSVHYGSHAAIKNASVRMEKGNITAIVGPSGCGKSSFLSALNRMTDLIPNALISGKITIDCCDIHSSEQSPIELRRCVGMIFQKPNPFPMSIRKNIEVALREHGEKSKARLREITRQVLMDVGLWEEVENRLDHSALQLSGGQQQRLCIARALALKPQVLLMDEPCSALDPIASAKVEQLIENLKGKYTIIIVTHNLAQAKRIADQVAVFWSVDGCGELIEFADCKKIFESPESSVTAQYLRGASG